MLLVDRDKLTFERFFRLELWVIVVLDLASLGTEGGHMFEHAKQLQYRFTICLQEILMKQSVQFKLFFHGFLSVFFCRCIRIQLWMLYNNYTIFSI